MNLPDLPPDVQFRLLPRTDGALRSSFEIKRAAMGPCIMQRWAWDKAYQLQTHRTHFEEKPFSEILHDGQQAGTVSVMKRRDHIRFGEFYLLPGRQGKGLGTRILRHGLSVADEQNIPVRLECLKWNPVERLYRRHGFVVTGESEIHYFMERPPLPPG